MSKQNTISEPANKPDFQQTWATLPEDEKANLIAEFKKGFERLLSEEREKLLSIQAEISELEASEREMWERERTMAYSPEKSQLSDQRQAKRVLLSLRKMLLMLQQNIVQAIENGGTYSTLTDAKGFEHNKIPDFRKIPTEQFVFDEDTILTLPRPKYIPIVDEDVFRYKGYLFDAIRIEKDSYLLAVRGYKEKDKSVDYYSPFVTVSLEQLVLIQDYYFTKAKAINASDAKEKTARQEKYWDMQPAEKRQKFLEQKNLYNSLPAKIQKTITKAEYEALNWNEKEKIYKFFKRYGAKRLSSRLEENQMWISFHEMYERFINPEAVPPKPRYANAEVFAYWKKFREMMDFMIKDIKIQREDYTDSYKQAIETSFGDSNTNLTLKEQFGILVKRQDGKTITPAEIDQIENTWVQLNQVFGNLVQPAERFGLKISHSANKNIFASKAIGVFIPTMRTIGVSNKYGPSQFDSTFAHEVGHFIDHLVGEKVGKRYATDNYEDTAGRIAFEFRDLMNKPKSEQTDYVNATKECFARAMQQYYGWKTDGENATIAHSYVDLNRTMSIYSADDYVNKEKFENKIVPLIEQFFSENKDTLTEYTPTSPLKTNNIEKLEPMKTKQSVKRGDIINVNSEAVFLVCNTNPLSLVMLDEKLKPGSVFINEPEMAQGQLDKGFEVIGKASTKAQKEQLTGEFNVEDFIDIGAYKFSVPSIVSYNLSPMDKGLWKIMGKYVGKDDLRPATSGINFDENGATATDSFKLMTIPGKVAKEGIFNKVGVKIDANFPDYKRIMPEVRNSDYIDVDVVALHQLAKLYKGIGIQSSRNAINCLIQNSLYGLNWNMLFDTTEGMLQLKKDGWKAYIAGPTKMLYFYNDNNTKKTEDDFIALQMPVMVNTWDTRKPRPENDDEEYKPGYRDLDLDIHTNLYFDFTENVIKDGERAIELTDKGIKEAKPSKPTAKPKTASYKKETAKVDANAKTFMDFISYKRLNEISDKLKQKSYSELKELLADQKQKLEQKTRMGQKDLVLRDTVWDLQELVNAHEKANEHNAAPPAKEKDPYSDIDVDKINKGMPSKMMDDVVDKIDKAATKQKFVVTEIKSLKNNYVELQATALVKQLVAIENASHKAFGSDLDISSIISSFNRQVEELKTGNNTDASFTYKAVYVNKNLAHIEKNGTPILSIEKVGEKNNPAPAKPDAKVDAKDILKNYAFDENHPLMILDKNSAQWKAAYKEFIEETKTMDAKPGEWELIKPSAKKEKGEPAPKSTPKDREKSAAQFIKDLEQQPDKLKAMSEDQIIKLGIQFMEENRSKGAQTTDKKNDAKSRLSPTPENLIRWMRNPGKFDLIGVDTFERTDPTKDYKKEISIQKFWNNIFGIKHNIS